MRVIGKIQGGLAALGLILGLAGGAQAQTDQGTFDLVMMGLKAGALHFTGVQDGAGYSVSGLLQSGGLVAMIRKVRYAATVQGSVSGGRYTPTGYSEDADTGKRQSQAVIGRGKDDFREGSAATQYRPFAVVVVQLPPPDNQHLLFR